MYMPSSMLLKYFNWIFIVEFFHQIKFKQKNIGAPERRNEASEWRTSDVAFPHGRLKAGRIMHLNDTLDQSPWTDHFFWGVSEGSFFGKKNPYFVRLISGPISLFAPRFQQGSKPAHQAMLLGIIKPPNSWCFFVFSVPRIQDPTPSCKLFRLSTLESCNTCGKQQSLRSGQ